MTSSAPRRLSASALAAPRQTAITVAPTALLICTGALSPAGIDTDLNDGLYPLVDCRCFKSSQFAEQAFEARYYKPTESTSLRHLNDDVWCRSIPQALTKGDFSHLDSRCAHTTCCTQNESCLAFLQVCTMQQGNMGCPKGYWKTCICKCWLTPNQFWPSMLCGSICLQVMLLAKPREQLQLVWSCQAVKWYLGRERHMFSLR